ncbi:MAG: beta-lactamase family protein [Kofleriaceae bacterium]|nr:beta-lactamase family protein [Kofleriaceae bacterium]
MRSLLQPIADDAIARQVTPGIVVLVSKDSKTIGLEAFGMTAGLEDSGQPVQTDTIYDAASITKSAVTSTLLMQMVAQGALSLDTAVAPLLPELTGAGSDAIHLRHLLGHSSGLPAHRHFFEAIWAGDLAGASNRRDALVNMAGAESLEYAPGTKTIYSDLGYILLGRLLERVADTPLETLFSERIAQPLAMRDSGFSSDIRNRLDRVAPSQRYPSRGLLHGEVHDDNANSAGGVCGHAGLFTTAQDLAKLAGALCSSYTTGQFIDRATLHSFWREQASPNTSWRMGWDTPSPIPGVSQSGDSWPSTGVGHLGFTGTAWWLAPRENYFVIILTNRVYYSWEKEGIKRLRRTLIDAIVSELL